MRFSKNNFMAVNYLLGGHQLEIVDSFINFGILLDTKLNFNDHLTLTVNKARSTIGFIKRWTKEFADPFVRKQLYISLLRPILEYGSIVWDSHYNIYSEHIETVQK